MIMPPTDNLSQHSINRLSLSHNYSSFIAMITKIFDIGSLISHVTINEGGAFGGDIKRVALKVIEGCVFFELCLCVPTWRLYQVDMRVMSDRLLQFYGIRLK